MCVGAVCIKYFGPKNLLGRTVISEVFAQYLRNSYSFSILASRVGSEIILKWVVCKVKCEVTDWIFNPGRRSRRWLYTAFKPSAQIAEIVGHLSQYAYSRNIMHQGELVLSSGQVTRHT